VPIISMKKASAFSSEIEVTVMKNELMILIRLNAMQRGILHRLFNYRTRIFILDNELHLIIVGFIKAVFQCSTRKP
jgi:hypothetical protein